MKGSEGQQEKNSECDKVDKDLKSLQRKASKSKPRRKVSSNRQGNVSEIGQIKVLESNTADKDSDSPPRNVSRCIPIKVSMNEQGKVSDNGQIKISDSTADKDSEHPPRKTLKSRPIKVSRNEQGKVSESQPEKSFKEAT